MNNVYIFISIFLFIFIFYGLFGLFKIKKNKLTKMNEYSILINRYHVDEKKYSKKQLVFIIAFCNAFIIANTSLIITTLNLDSYFWSMLLATLVLGLLIIIVYGVVGKIIGSKK